MPGVGPARRPRRSDIAVRVRTFLGLQARHHLGLPVLLEDLSNAYWRATSCCHRRCPAHSSWTRTANQFLGEVWVNERG